MMVMLANPFQESALKKGSLETLIDRPSMIL